MRVTIYQPQYFPRLHYFNRILNADVFVILDSAQFTKSLIHVSGQGRVRHKSYQTVAPIKINTGIYQLTVSVKQKTLPINRTALEYMHKWNYKHPAIIKANYNNAKMFQMLFPTIKSFMLQQYQTLADLNIATILWGINSLLDSSMLSSELTIENVNKRLSAGKQFRLKKIVRDEDTGVPRLEGRQKGTEWTAEICQALSATEYFHGETAGSGYMEFDYYKKRGIIPVTQKWRCPEYTQQYTEKVGFIENLSILDLLLNEDKSIARKVLGDS